MKKLIQPLRLLVQACFMAGLFLPIFPFADNIGQKIWITILFVGVIFCGWICPFGALQDWLGWIAQKLHFPRYKLPQKLQQYVQLLRYVLYGLSNSRFFFEHSVVSGLCEWLIGSVMALFLLATLFTDRPFCNYFCVKGASLGVWSVLRPIGITREEKSCVHCSKCDQICPMNIEVSKTAFVRHPNYINCMQCLTACPTGCIKFKLIHSKR